MTQNNAGNTNDKIPMIKYLIAAYLVCIGAVIKIFGKHHILLIFILSIVFFLIQTYYVWFKPLKTSKHYLKRANEYIKIGKKSEALKLLKTSLEQDNIKQKDKKNILNQIAFIYFEQKQYNEYIQICKELMEVQDASEHTETLYKIGFCYYQKQDFTTANWYFKQACESAVNSKTKIAAKAFITVAESFANVNKTAEAKYLYEQLLQNKLCKKSLEVERILKTESI